MKKLRTALAIIVLFASAAAMLAQDDLAGLQAQDKTVEEKLAPEFREMLDEPGGGREARFGSSSNSRMNAAAANEGLVTCLVRFKTKPGPAQDSIVTAKGGAS